MFTVRLPCQGYSNLPKVSLTFLLRWPQVGTHSIEVARDLPAVSVYDLVGQVEQNEDPGSLRIQKREEYLTPGSLSDQACRHLSW